MTAESFEQQWKFWVDNKYTQDWLKTSAHANFLKHKHKDDVSEFKGSQDKVKNAVTAYYFEKIIGEEIEAMQLDLTWYNSGNPEQKYKLKKLMLVQVASKATRNNKSERGNECAWCQLLGIEGEHEVFHDDHTFPLSLGGSDEDWNKQTLCESHNSIKSSFPIPIQNKMSSNDFLERHIQLLNKLLNDMR
jgi:hypothetical protein